MENQQPPSGQHCRNCGTTLPDDANFCPQCGQKNTDGRLSIGELLNHFLDSILNLDGRIFKTLKSIVVPGKLTVDYFNGKHVPYYHPVRLFVVFGAILIATISLSIDQDDIAEANKPWKQYENNHLKHEHMDELEQIRDSLVLIYSEPNVSAALDSMLNNFRPGGKDSTNISVTLNTEISENTVSEDGIRVDIDDLVTLSTDSLITKYNIEGFWDRLFFAQSIRIQKSGDSFIYYIIGNILWMMLVMMPMLALVLKLLYVRRDFLYFEHLIFSFHTHTAIFIILSLLLLFSKFTTGLVVGMAFLLMALYLAFAMKRFYRQGWGKTILKFILANIAYLFILITAIVMVAIVSLLLF